MTTHLITLSGEQQELADETIDEIRSVFRGVVLTAQDADYDEVRMVQNAMFDRRPGLILRCSGVADVVDAIEFGRQRDLLMSVRGGGHSIAGTCTADDAMMIDLSAMRGVWVDAERRRVRVAGGCVWGDVDRETQLHGLAVPGGVVSTTGVAGLTLGGGIGWLHRKYGLACDALRSAEIVTPEGELLRVSETEHEELFWALRGGGGNFGVVVSFEFEAYPVGPMVWDATVMYAIEDAGEVMPQWRDWTTTVPDEITTRALYWTMPDSPLLPPEVRGRDVLIAAALYAGDADEGRDACAEIGRFATPIIDISETVPYRMAQSSFDPFFPKGGLESYWKSVYLDRIDDDAIAMIDRIGTDRPHPMTLIHVPLLGGAMGRVDAAETAFGDRSADYMLSIDGNWLDPADDEGNVEWVRSAHRAAVDLNSASGTYLNFGGDPDLNDYDREQAWGRNLARLRSVKRTYDPQNRFRLNANIPPEE